MSLLANIGRLFLLRVSSQVVLLFSIIAFTRLAVPKVLGQYFYFEAVLGFTGLFVAFGIGGSTEKFVSEESEPNKWYSTGLILTLMSTIFGSIIFVLVNYRINILDESLVLLFVLALISKQFITFYRHVFRSELRAVFDGIINMATSVIYLAVSVTGLYIGYGVKAIIIGFISSRLLLIPFSMLYTDRTIVRPSLAKSVQLLNFAKFYFITVIGDKLFNYIDIIIIGLLLSSASVGKYNVTWKLISAGILLNGIFAKTLFSYVSEASSKNDVKTVERDFHKTLNYILVLPLAAIFGSLVLGNETVEVLFTSEYIANQYLLLALAVGFIFQPIYFLFSRVLVAIGKPKQSLVGTVLAIISNVFLNIILVSFVGLIGAAVATTASFLVASTVLYFILNKILTVSLPIKKYSIQLVSAMVMMVTLLGIKSYLGVITSYQTIVRIVFGAIVYILTMCLHKETRNDILEILDQSLTGS